MRKIYKTLIKLSKKNLVLCSFICSVFSFLFSSLIWEMAILIAENNVINFDMDDIVEINEYLDKFYTPIFVLLYAPILETIIFIVIYKIFRIYLTKYSSSFLSAACLCAMHSSLLQAIVVFPLFIISILLFTILQRRSSYRGIISLALIHFLHNLFVLSTSEYY